MKKTLIAVLAVISTTFVAVPTPAEAAGCVTRSEYRAVKVGWTKARVHRKFGTTGKRLSIAWAGGYAGEVRIYKVCKRPAGNVTLSFDKKPNKPFKLVAKSAVWGG